MFRQKAIVVSLFALALTACTRPANVATPTPEISPKNSDKQEFNQAEFERDRARFARNTVREGLDVQMYELTGKFDWATLRLNAQVKITFRSVRSDSLVLDSNVEKINSVRTVTGEALPFSASNSLLTIGIAALGEAQDKQVVIDYVAAANFQASGEGSSFTAVPHRNGDPVMSRVAYTASEPLGASQWMPCNNVPTDRARFGTDFTIERDEKLISNGDLIEESIVGHEKHMRYATQYTIPTYLMAFAFGQLEMKTLMHGDLPVSFVYRRGLSGDFEGMVKEVIKNITSYEALLTPFPFEKYDVVVLPDFPIGGIENAGITFQAEHRSSQSQLSYDLGLAAHELGHQWFGDFITVTSWDDLWIKEGMATLLAEESSRHYSDMKNSGRLYGANFDVASGDAIQDPELPPEAKYTSGPYGRSAWFLTQLRSKVGEQKFWATMKKMLTDNAYGNISTEKFLTAFSAVLSPEEVAKAKTALSAKKMPVLKADKNADGAIVVTLTDPDNAMLVPLSLGLANESGMLRKTILNPGESKVLDVPANHVLVIDPQDVQAVPSFDIEASFQNLVSPLLIPKGEKLWTIMKGLPPNAEELALQFPALWNFSEKEVFDKASDVVSSSDAEYLLIKMACNVAKRNAKPETAAAWTQQITETFMEPPLLGLTRGISGVALSECGKFTEPAKFAASYEALQNDPSGHAISEPYVLFLAHMDQAADTALKTWGALLQKASTVRTQVVALATLGKRLAKNTAFTAPSAEQLVSWKALLNQVVAQNQAQEVQNTLIPILLGLKDKAFVLPLAQIAQKSLRSNTQNSAVCAAFALSRGDENLWKQFVSTFGEIKTWNPKLQSTLSAPAEHCGAE